METRDLATLKSREFAVKIVGLYRNLCSEKKEFVLSKQILKSGTSIGANLAEARYAISKRDYLSKKSIALKECSETVYWLELMKDTGLISQNVFDALAADAQVMLRLLAASVKNLKENNE